MTSPKQFEIGRTLGRPWGSPRGRSLHFETISVHTEMLEQVPAFDIADTRLKVRVEVAAQILE